VHLHAFLGVAVFAIGAFLARALGMYGGGRIGAKLAGLDPDLAKRVPLGMLPQAGIAIGLANLVKTSFPGWGEGAATLILGTVVLNEMLGPIIFRAALVASGEAGRKVELGEGGRPSFASAPHGPQESAASETH
jgi:hypothetical protein